MGFALVEIGVGAYAVVVIGIDTGAVVGVDIVGIDVGVIFVVVVIGHFTR